MPEKRKALGSAGERLATDYLIAHGYSVETTNWHYRHHEIDIIATKGGMTHVVEVKTRNQADQITLPELVKRHQERSIIEAAEAYAKLHPSPLGVQIDIMLILVHPYKPSQIEYYPDAIRPMF